MNPPLKVAARPCRAPAAEDRLGAAVAAGSRVLGAGPELEPQQVRVHRHDAGHERGVHVVGPQERGVDGRDVVHDVQRPPLALAGAAACPRARPAAPGTAKPGCGAGAGRAAGRARCGRAAAARPRCARGRPARMTACRPPSATCRRPIPRMSPAVRDRDRGPIPPPARRASRRPDWSGRVPSTSENQAKISTNTAAAIRKPRRSRSRRRDRPGPGGPGGAPSRPGPHIRAATGLGRVLPADPLPPGRTGVRHACPPCRPDARTAGPRLDRLPVSWRPAIVRNRPHGMEHTAQNRRVALPFSNITVRYKSIFTTSAPAAGVAGQPRSARPAWAMPGTAPGNPRPSSRPGNRSLLTCGWPRYQPAGSGIPSV